MYEKASIHVSIIEVFMWMGVFLRVFELVFVKKKSATIVAMQMR